MQNTDKTDTQTVMAQGTAPVKFGQSFIGCVKDCSTGSADYLNGRTINFAEYYGFKSEPIEVNSEDLSEEADEAVSWLNEQDNLPFCSWYFEDNSLFYAPSVEMAREDVGFVSSEDNDYPEDGYEGEWLHVSDHGNCTLYVREKGENREIWGIV